MHPAFWRTLENWTTYQDYFWFLALLAWAAFLGAELWKNDRAATEGRRWLVGVAGFQIAGALVELVLLAQDIMAPYVKVDFALGACQAGCAAALVWGASQPLRARTIIRSLSVLILSALAVARISAPVTAGAALAGIQALALLALARLQRDALPSWIALLLTLQPVIATHGPWAYAINHGRRMIDWSHFALLAAGLALIAGVGLAVKAWRQRLQAVVPEGRLSLQLRRDFKRAIAMLVAWILGGILLAFWYGAHAQRAFEDNFRRRVEIMAFAFEPAQLVEALAAELRIQEVVTQHFTHGAPIEVATIPETSKPVFAQLRGRGQTLQAQNPDIRFFCIGIVRDDRFVLLDPGEPGADGAVYTKHIIYPQEFADLARLREPKSHFHGPIVSYQFGAMFESRVPLLHPETGALIGWLFAAVDATRWAANFTQARLQTMALVAAGIGLWTVAVAYRLRREAKDAAEQKALAAAAADRMKSAFLAKVSHELRTPIQSVLGYGELLASAPLGEPHRTWLHALRTHGDVMLRLVNDLIDLGALQSGSFQLVLAPVRLPHVLEECVGALRPAASAKGLRFIAHIDATLPAWVMADGVRLRQILLNLLNNAVKFTPEGTVTLAVRSSGAELVEIEVSDTGPGIPEAQRARLFQPFARLDPTAAGGSGLGLALVQGLCTAMSGTVSYVAHHAGARFVVRLPLTPCEPPHRATEVDSAAGHLQGLRVLVAEDNTLVRDLLVAFLGARGVDLIVARDGLSALALARQHAPEVIVLDIALPGIDGIDVAKKLREERGTTTRIIGLSAHAGPADERRAREAGMDEFLSKPVRLQELARVLAAAPRAARLEEPLEALDETLRTRLAAEFARETPQVLTEMRANLAAQNWPQLRRRAHYLKNSADVLGLRALQTACDELYRLSDFPAAPAAALLLRQVEAAIPPQLLILEPSE